MTGFSHYGTTTRYIYISQGYQPCLGKEGGHFRFQHTRSITTHISTIIYNLLISLLIQIRMSDSRFSNLLFHQESNTGLFHHDSSTGLSVASVTTKNRLQTLMASQKCSDLILLQNTGPHELYDFLIGSDSFKFKFKVLQILNSPVKYLYLCYWPVMTLCTIPYFIKWPQHNQSASLLWQPTETRGH
jgi:hypothetical protein